MSRLIPSNYYTNKHVIISFLQSMSLRHNFSSDVFELQNRVSGKVEDCEQGLVNSQSKIYIHISDEHTLVLPGGRHLPPNSRPGKVPSLDGHGFYLVCLNYPNCVAASDVTIDYSNMNIQNLQLSGFFTHDLMQKFVYVPCLPFAFEPTKSKHAERGMMTTFWFTNPRGDRRTEINEQISTLGFEVKNINFKSLEEYYTLLEGTRILVNVHQTPHHHTLEELRILPALSRGVIIVSESVPLQEYVPFSEYIVFAPYHELAKTAADVYKNYTEHWNRIFGPSSKLNETLSVLLSNSYTALETRVLAVARSKKII